MMTEIARPDSAEPDIEEALSREWLDSNGRGGYACSTVAGAHTRRVHGLLVVRPVGATEPVVLLSKVDETVHIERTPTHISCSIYADAVQPAHPLLPREFQHYPFPRFLYRSPTFSLRKTVFMPRGENAVVLRYNLLAANGPAELEIRPFVAARGVYGLTRESVEVGAPPAEYGNRLVFRPPPGFPAFQLAHSGADVTPSGHWYRSFRYPLDETGPGDGTEDLFNPCALRFRLEPGGEAWVVVSTRLVEIFDATVREWEDLELYRRKEMRLPRRRGEASDLDRQLMSAAERFLVRQNEHGPAIVRGYPDSSFDTRAAMIALPGLLLATGRTSEARRMLVRVAQQCRDGVLPESLDTSQATEEPRAETGLWFVHAVERYLKHTGDLETVSQEPYAAVKQIILGLRYGGHPGARMEPDGLLTLTSIHTSRGPRPVELQALWYQGLGVATFLAQNIESARQAHPFSLAARRCRQSFQEIYWNEEGGCLFDRVLDGVPDATIRPYQVLAASFPDAPLDRKQRERIVSRVRRELAEPLGLRDPGVPGRVHPWWIGPLATATVLALGRNARTETELEGLLAPLLRYLEGPGCGRIPECFNYGRPAGQLGDAVATAELLRARLELVTANR